MTNWENEVAELIQEIGEAVYIHYEPRNEEMEWTVGLLNDDGLELPIHEHFSSLLEGLEWMRDHKHLFAEWRTTRPGGGSQPPV